MGTGIAVATGAIITHTTMNKKLESVAESEVDAQSADGLHVKRIARATYDFATDGGAISTISLGVTLPDNAAVIKAWYQVLTTLTSVGDNATVSIDIPTDDEAGILAAVAIDDGSNPWDANGMVDCIQTGAAANVSEQLTAARLVSITIAVEAVTAGKFIVWLEYVVSD